MVQKQASWWFKTPTSKMCVELLRDLICQRSLQEKSDSGDIILPTSNHSLSEGCRDQNSVLVSVEKERKDRKK